MIVTGLLVTSGKGARYKASGQAVKGVPSRSAEEAMSRGVGSPAVLVFVGVVAALALIFSSSSASKLLGTHSGGIAVNRPVPVLVSLKNRLKQRVIRDSEGISPMTGEDFLLFVWVKLSRLPAPHSRAVAVVKFDAEEVMRPGFAIALARKEDGLRPEVYWKGNSLRGGWYSFPEVHYAPRDWTLLALSYRDDRFLGLHAVARNPGHEPRVIMLGGHVVDGSAPPRVQVPIDVGAVNGGSSFRGDIGPIGIVAGHRLAEYLPSLLKAIDQNPSSPPDLPPSLRIVSFASDASAVREEG